MQSSYIRILLEKQKREESGLSKPKTAKKHKSFQEKIKNVVRKILAFFLTQIGVCALVIGYTIAGAFAFMSIEGPYELVKAEEMLNVRNEYVKTLWNITEQLNVLNEEEWRRNVEGVIKTFQERIVNEVVEGYDGKEEKIWTFPASLMYSLNIYTTIGKKFKGN